MKLRSFLTLLAGFSALLISAVLTVALPLHSLDSPTGAPSGISAGTGVTPTWATGRVDAEKTFSISNRSLAVDSNNHLHAAYGQDRLYYAFNGGAGWQLTTVDYAWGTGGGQSLATEHINEQVVIDKLPTHSAGVWAVCYSTRGSVCYAKPLRISTRTTLPPHIATITTAKIYPYNGHNFFPQPETKKITPPPAAT